jgi:hypothetical protein
MGNQLATQTWAQTAELGRSPAERSSSCGTTLEARTRGGTQFSLYRKHSLLYGDRRPTIRVFAWRRQGSRVWISARCRERFSVPGLAQKVGRGWFLMRLPPFFGRSPQRDRLAAGLWSLEAVRPRRGRSRPPVSLARPDFSPLVGRPVVVALARSARSFVPLRLD